MAHNKLYRNFIILQEDEKTHAASGEKALSGYAKIEAKNDKCKISFYAQNLKVEERYSIVLICYKKDIKQIVDLGSLTVKDSGKGEISKEYYVNNIGGINLSYEKISGAAVCKHKEGKIHYLMYGFMNGEHVKDDWKKCKVVKHSDGDEIVKVEKKIETKKIEPKKVEPKKVEEKNDCCELEVCKKKSVLFVIVKKKKINMIKRSLKTNIMNMKKINMIKRSLKINVMNMKKINMIKRSIKTSVMNMKKINMIKRSIKINVMNMKKISMIKRSLKINVMNMKKISMIKRSIKTNIMNVKKKNMIRINIRANALYVMERKIRRSIVRWNHHIKTVMIIAIRGEQCRQISMLMRAE